MLTPTTRVPKLTVSSERVGQALEKHGWLKSVAGEADFDLACRAISDMFARGRGLFLTGGAGCGKTKLLQALREAILETVNVPFWVYCKDNRQFAWLRNNDEMFKHTVYLDDIGAEEIVHEYGNVIDVVGDFVQRYHNRGEGRFMASTNLNSAEINHKYGGRVLDRIMEMCVVLKLGGKSKRERIVYGM